MTLAELADELGPLKTRQETEEAQFAAKTAKRRARIEALEADIQSRYESAPAAKPVEAQGKKWLVVLGMRGNQSVVDVAAAFKRLGESEFLKHGTIALGVLKKLLPKHEHDEYIATARTGPRSLTVVKKGAAAAVSSKAA